jgi:hypothetical protein
MTEVSILGINVRFRNRIPTGAVANLTDTLRLVPPEHRADITRIAVVPPLALGDDPNYAGGGSAQGYPRLSELVLTGVSDLTTFLTI